MALKKGVLQNFIEINYFEKPRGLVPSELAFASQGDRLFFVD
jgi:hypothetical protein